MFELLKSEARGLRTQTLFLKEKERHYLQNARLLSGYFKKKHQKGENGQKFMDEFQLALIQKLSEPSLLAQKDYERFWNLQHTRKNIVRKMARDVHLALAFLKGTHPLVVERKKRENPNWDMIELLVVDHSEEDERVVLQRFAEWRDAGDYPPISKKKLKKTV